MLSGQNIYLGSFLWNAIRMAPNNMYESIQRHLWASVTIREKSGVQVSTSHNCRKYWHKASPCHHLAMLSTVSMSSRSFCLGHVPLDWIQPSLRNLWDGSHLSGDLRILAADAWIWQGSGSRNHYLVQPVSLTHSELRVWDTHIPSRPGKSYLLSLRRPEAGRKNLVSGKREISTVFTAPSRQDLQDLNWLPSQSSRANLSLSSHSDQASARCPSRIPGSVCFKFPLRLC